MAFSHPKNVSFKNKSTLLVPEETCQAPQQHLLIHSVLTHKNNKTLQGF